jgi:Uma2 family endonuclease
MAFPKELMKLSVEEYLALEEKSEVRHEYVAGYIFALAGASDAHNVIAGNIYTRFRSHIRGSDCRAYMVDMKVRVEAVDAFYYPDLMVTCEAFDAKSVFKSKPVLLVEILSPGTEVTDRREKLSAYFKLESLIEYVLVSQAEKRIEIYRRDKSGKIQMQVLGSEDEICFESAPNGALTLTMDDIYEDVIFNQQVQPPEDLNSDLI